VYVGGIIGLVVILLSVLIIVGVLGLSNLVVGGLFLALGLGLFGPIVDRYGRPAP
jgi:hypothetical protein